MPLRQLIVALFVVTGLLGSASTAYADMDLDAGMDMPPAHDASTMDGGIDMPPDLSDDMGGFDGGDVSDGGDMASDDFGPSTDMSIDTPDDGQDMAASDDAAGDLSTPDVGSDAGDAVYTFSGTATLRGALAGQVSIQITGEDDASTQRNVASGERFMFEDLPAGEYTVRVSAAGFDSVEDTLSLNFDTTRDYVLFSAATGMVYIETELDEQPTGTVTLSARSERGSFVESIEIESGVGQFSDEFKVGTWQLEFRSEGFREVNHTLHVTRDEPSTTVTVRLYRNSVADVLVNEGCSCDVTGASRAQTALVFCVLVLFVVVSRMRRRFA